MTPWAELVATALLGTDRRPTADGPAGLLDAAAAWTPYRRAGQPPTASEALTTAAPPEPLPLAPMGASRRLTRLLEGGPGPLDSATRDVVLAEWLGLATQHGRRVPPHLLPALLDLGRYRTDLRALIGSTGGERARWLAELNPAWRYVTRVAHVSIVDLTEEQWTAGNRAQRLGYFRHRRRTDPVAARELLESEWTTVTPDERAELVATLGSGLTLADEPVLERALDDRRKEVREAAVVLLVRLPGSAYQGRQLERARACVAINQDELAVDPPVECDRAMRRDGITVKPPGGIGERAWWLEEILAHAPLPAEAQRFVALTAPDDWAATVHRGLARAAAAQRDPVWAAALLDRLGDGPRDRAIAVSLYPVLDPGHLINRALAALTEGATARWSQLLGACPAPWPEELGRAALDGLATMAERPNMAGELYHLSRLAAVRMPVSLAASARELAPHHAGLTTFAAVLSYRYEMTQEMLS